MNKKLFRQVVDRLTSIVTAHGATSAVVEYDAFIAKFTDVAVTVFIDDGPYGAHWHTATRNLAVGVFDASPYDAVKDLKRNKATQIRDNWPDLFKALEASCGAVANGTAFA